jgi:hypothetical protein
MWFLVKISIYRTFIASLLKKFIFWNENSQISHMIFKHGSYYVNMVQYTSTFIKIKNHLNCFWNIFVFLNTQIHYIHFHKYTPISRFMKWNEIVSFLICCIPKFYSNIICKNNVNFFQKFEVGYTQTCTSLESSTMWHPKGGHRSVLSPICEREFAIPSLPWTKQN